MIKLSCLGHVFGLPRLHGAASHIAPWRLHAYGESGTISYGVMQQRALAHFRSGTALAEEICWLALYQMGAQVKAQGPAYHGPPDIETRRPWRDCLAVRGSRRISEAFTTFRVPSAAGCATSMSVRDLPASKPRRSIYESGEGSLQQVPGIGPRSEQRFISAGITSLPGLLNMFFEGEDGDKGRMRSFIEVVHEY